MLKTREVGAGRPLVVLPGFGLDGTVMAACFEPALACGTTGRTGPLDAPGTGRSGGPVLPVVPGSPGSPGSPGAAGGGVVGDGWRRIYVDLPGMGSPATGAATSEAVLGEVVDTVEQVGEPVALAAHSYGGYLAAAVTRRRPDLLERVLLVCPGVVIERTRRDLGGVLPSVASDDSWLDDVPEALHEHFTQAVGHQTRPVARIIARALAARAPRDDDYLERLQKDGYALDDEGGPISFDRSITLIAGRRDRVTGYRDQLRLLESYPAGTFTALAGAGHYLPFEQPTHFAAALRDWLDPE